MNTFQAAQNSISELDRKKADIALQYQKQATTDIKGRFDKSTLDVYEEKFKNSTVGLISRDEFMK